MILYELGRNGDGGLASASVGGAPAGVAKDLLAANGGRVDAEGAPTSRARQEATQEPRGALTLLTHGPTGEEGPQAGHVFHRQDLGPHLEREAVVVAEEGAAVGHVAEARVSDEDDAERREAPLLGAAGLAPRGHG